MKNILYGNTGLRVSELSLGTMTFGTNKGIEIDEAKKIFNSFTNAGGNFLDTANIYNTGESEELIGDFISANRDDFVIATKYVFATPNEGLQHRGAGRKSLKIQVEASLKKLNTDYIDILYIHGFDPLTPYQETVNALNDLIKSGKVLYIGASNVPAWWLARANAYASLNNMSRFEGIQVFYNLLDRSAEREIHPYCNFENVSLVSWSPLSGGLLTDKYYHNLGAESGRMAGKFKDRLQDDFTNKVLKTLNDIAVTHELTISQVSLAWQIQRGIMPIVGASKQAQIDDNLKAVTCQLTTDDITSLNQASAIEAGIPLSYLQEDKGANSVYNNVALDSPLLDYCHGGGFSNKSPW